MRTSFILLYFSLLTSSLTIADVLNYSIEVKILPSKVLNATVTIQFPKNDQKKYSFFLNKNFKPEVVNPEDHIEIIHTSPNENDSEWGLTLGPSDNKVKLVYSGIVDDPVPIGVQYLASSLWYPFFYNYLLIYDLNITAPALWKVHNQGNLTLLTRNQEMQNLQYRQIYPQEEINLIAGPYFEHSKSDENYSYKIWLTKEDNELANSYLNLIPGYIEHYEKILGKYPYPQMVVVENYEETGWGLPSFTLLGPTVIRLPFILYSSLPHEILHNWWGNGVFVDYSQGNWSEGLTSYMSDHWQQEITGKDNQYRQNTLIGYGDFVKNEKDFPLKDFKSRHDESSQAIGYGKGMMFFHMLRVKLGDKIFFSALKDFYESNVYHQANYSDLKTSFEKVSQYNLANYFEQWVNQTGAVKLELGQTDVILNSDNTYDTQINLKQIQEQNLFQISVPILLKMDNGVELRRVITFDSREVKITIGSSKKPISIEVDPQYDVFRSLYPEEHPVTLSQILGSEEVKVVKVSDKNESQNKALNALKSVLTNKITVVNNIEDYIDDDAESVLFIGDHPLIREKFKKLLQKQNFKIESDVLTIEGNTYNLNEISFLLSSRDDSKPNQTFFWLNGSENANIENMITRMIHYNKYGNLIFKDKSFVYKNTWKTINSPLKRAL